MSASENTLRGHSPYSINLVKEGPMRVRLKMRDSPPMVACIIGYDRSTPGAIGEVEASGRVVVGHALIAINDISLVNKPFDSILEIIKAQPPPSTQVPRKLSFSSVEYIRTFKEKFPDRSLDECCKVESDLSYAMHIESVHKTILNGGQLDDRRLRLFAQKGLPDGNGGIRSILWKILLGYLPLDTSSWDGHLSGQRDLYKSLLKEMTITSSQLEASLPHDSLTDGVAPSGGPGKFQSVMDHPLHVDENQSNWAKYWSDSLLIDSIQKDVIRTYPDLKFFLEGEGSRQDALQNILFLFAKLNPAIKYVQGMNELVGTLFYVFANDQNSAEWSTHAEADTFFCFTLLMGEIRDMYIHNMDNTSSGITGRIQRFTDVLKTYDADLNDLLLSQGIEPSFYSLRWITTILSREFDLLDTIRLWDTFLADDDRDEFLCYICTTMVLEQKASLMMGDFGENLSLLQSYPPMDVTYLLRKMDALRRHHSRNEDDSSSPYPSSPSMGDGRHSPSLSLLQTLQSKQELKELNSAELLAAGMNDMWRASASLSKLVSNAGTGIKTAVFKNTADRYGEVRSFTAFDGACKDEDWSQLCSTGQAFDLIDNLQITATGVRESSSVYVADEPIDFGSTSDCDSS